MKEFSVAIIGFGPKGLYAFERLLARIKASSLSRPISIFLFNKTTFFGSGDIYRSDQPRFLRMNYTNELINCWSKNKPAPIVQNPLTYVEWKSNRENISSQSLVGNYSARAEVGEYLEWCFTSLLKNLPENCSVYQKTEEITDLKKNQGKINLYSGARKFPVEFDQIMLTTGHQRHKTQKNNSSIIPFIYPVEEKLKEIQPKSRIAIKGFGLTFIDAVLALTEGKGGKFITNETGFTYEASGNEPGKLIPFSLSGLPMLPKTYSEKSLKHPSYLSSAKLKFSRPYNFENQLFPLILQDLIFSYYTSLFQQKNEELYYAEDFEKVTNQIEKFHEECPETEKFDWEKLSQPKLEKKNLHDSVVEYLSFLISEKEKNSKSPYLAAAGAWKNISSDFNDLYSFNGLDPKSQQLFDTQFSGLFNRIAFGPPVENLQKIEILARCGIIDFSFTKKPIIKITSEEIQLKNSEKQQFCDYLIDARIPKNSFEKEKSGLFYKIVEQKIGTINKNKDADWCYAPGNLAISKKGDLLQPSGMPDMQISLYGIPTEGAVYDNDTLSRKRNDFTDFWAEKVLQYLKKENYE